MRLLFIHGINQGQMGAEDLRLQWLKYLIDNATAPDLFESVDSRMAYYADVLAEASEFLEDGLGEVVDAYHMEQRSLDSKAGPIENVALDWPNPLAFALRILAEATVYFTNVEARDKIDARVRAQLESATSGANQLIIVGHSLGTVIAFKLLRELSQSQAEWDLNDPRRISVPLLITVGSPLPIGFVRRALGGALERPALVDKWWNFYDVADPITLGKGLTPPLFAQGIDNDGAVKNQSLARHLVHGYFAYNRLMATLEAALSVR